MSEARIKNDPVSRAKAIKLMFLASATLCYLLLTSFDRVSARIDSEVTPPPQI